MRPETIDMLTTRIEQAGRDVAAFVRDVLKALADDAPAPAPSEPAQAIQAPQPAAAASSPADPDQLLEAEEAAELLRVKVKTLYSWASRGKVPHRKVGSRVLFHRGELMRWTAAQAQEEAQARQTRRRRAGLRVIQ